MADQTEYTTVLDSNELVTVSLTKAKPPNRIAELRYLTNGLEVHLSEYEGLCLEFGEKERVPISRRETDETPSL